MNVVLNLGVQMFMILLDFVEVPFNPTIHITNHNNTVRISLPSRYIV